MASNGIQIPSLCIPRVYFQFDEAYIEQVFVSIFGGVPNGDQGMKSCIQKIDLVGREDRKTGEPFNIVFIHFHDGVANTPETKSFVEKIESGQEVKLMYRHPWFWKARKNNATRYEPRQNTNKPRMILSEEDEAEVMKHQKEYYANRQVTLPPPLTDPGEFKPPTENVVADETESK